MILVNTACAYPDDEYGQRCLRSTTSRAAVMQHTWAQFMH